MSLTTILMVLGAVAAFVYGIWAGLGRWDQSQEEIDRALAEDRPPRRASRHVTPLDLMSKITGVSVHRDWSRAFRFEREDRPEEGRDPEGAGDGPGDGGTEPGEGEEDLEDGEGRGAARP